MVAATQTPSWLIGTRTRRARKKPHHVMIRSLSENSHFLIPIWHRWAEFIQSSVLRTLQGVLRVLFPKPGGRTNYFEFHIPVMYLPLNWMAKTWLSLAGRSSRKTLDLNLESAWAIEYHSFLQVRRSMSILWRCPPAVRDMIDIFSTPSAIGYFVFCHIDHPLFVSELFSHGPCALVANLKV